MPDADDLIAYTQTRSPEALAHLVNRHIDFVYASALRQVKDSALAEDVAQAVFIILTRKAGSIRPNSLTGWLFNTTRHCAANARRSEQRRRHHERQAAKPEEQMQLEDSSAPLLDHALSRLRSSDREVVLLRFFQQREFTEVGSILGISEQTARRRLNRAVERLRQLLSVGSQILPSAAVIQTLSTTSTQAPPHLSAQVLAATSNLTAGSAAANLAVKTLHAINWIKIKIAATILIAAAVAGGGSVAIVKAVASPAAVVTAPAAPPAGIAPAAAPTTGAVATFPDGMRVELVGIAPSPIKNQKWWKPDGSPLLQPPIRREYGQVMAPMSKVYTFIAKITGADPTWDTGVNVEGSNGISSSDQGNLLCVTAAMPQSATTGTLDFICANGPWQTRAVISADALYKTGVNLNGIVFTPGDDPKTNTVKLFADHASMNALFTGAAEFLAVDLDGKPVHSSGMQGQGSLLSETKTYSFTKLRPDQIKEFQIRSRPFNRTAKFENISLVPGQLTTPTVKQQDSGKFSASFTAGGSLEVLGISDFSSPHKWWNADGSDRDEIPLADGAANAFRSKRGDKTYAIAVKWNHQGNDNSSVNCSFSNSHSIIILTGAAQTIPESPDIYLLTCPAGVTNTNFRVGMTSGSWQTDSTVNSDGRAAGVATDQDKFDFSAPADVNGEATLTVKDSLSDVDRRLVATDNSGTTHIAEMTKFLRQGTTSQCSYRVRGVASAQIKSYQFQTRRFEYINFNNITLKPDQHTDITIGPDSPPTPTVAPKPPGEEGL